MEQYVVEVWKTRERIAERVPDYDEVVAAHSHADALKNVLREKGLSGMFYAEVHLNVVDVEKAKRYRFTDENFELLSHGSLKSGRKNEKLVNSGHERSLEH